MKVVFLDYDGVVNTPLWDDQGNIDFNHPLDGKVNNYQAIMWLNELLWKTGVAVISMNNKQNVHRDFIGIELDEQYFKIAKQRIESANKFPDLN